MADKHKLLLIDGNSVAFRAFYAMYQSLEKFKNRNGLHTNAIYAFHNMMESILSKEKPSHVLVAFDAGKTTFRHETYTDYKAGRSKTPGEFKEQMPYIREMVEALGMKYYEIENYEADDIIGTLAKKVSPEEFDVVVISGDKDLTQLASENIRVDVTVKGVSQLEAYTPEHIEEKYGLAPMQIVDMKALAGDNSDNLPGVAGIGEKTAIALLKEFGSLEGVYENVEGMKKSKRKENLINDKEQAFMCKKLATIYLETPIDFTVDDLAYNGKDLDKLIPLYKEMDFNTFLSKVDSNAGNADAEDLIEINYTQVTEVNEAMLGAEMSLYVEMLDGNYHTSDIVGVSWGTKEAIYVATSADVLSQPIFVEWLQNKETKKHTYDVKRTVVALNRYGIKLEGATFDVLLASYLLDTNDKSADLAEVAYNYDYRDIETDESVYGKGAKRGLPEDDILVAHLARKIKAIETLTPLLSEQLTEKEQHDLFYDMEFPLSFVLAKMEIQGIKVDAQRLTQMKQEFAVTLSSMEQRIYELAGTEFNINSPKQLGVILFEKMGLPVVKKTKTGYSTAVDVLEQLKSSSPIIEEILNYRQIAKIQSTYVEGLLKVISPTDGKIHTRYVQTLTQTGRLSSVEPNLQNIPVRLEEGRKIRQAFIPREADWKMFASDYSQIELRVLADISKDEHLQAAFKEGQDIHTSTAMRVFDIQNPEEVTSNIRRQAKAVNFGVVYGISDYGLSQNLGITRKEAKEFIDTYFDKYPGVKEYMHDIVREAKDKGYVETLWHRRRYLPDINSRNFNIRSFAERTAINTPIQGSAADILKLAMIEIDQRLTAEKMQATMLLQVHDELVFEAPPEEIEKLDHLVAEIMEGIGDFSVPIIADSSVGDTWYEAK